MRHSHIEEAREGGREREEAGDMSKTRNNPTTLTSPLCNPCTARALHKAGYRKAKPCRASHFHFYHRSRLVPTFYTYLKSAHLVVVDFTELAGILWGHKLRSL